MTPNFRPDEILNDLHCIKLYPKSSRLLRTAALSLSRPELTWKTKRACAVPCFRPFSSEPVVVGRCFRSLMFILLYTGILSSILSWKDCFHFYLTASMPLPPPNPPSLQDLFTKCTICFGLRQKIYIRCVTSLKDWISKKVLIISWTHSMESVEMMITRLMNL